MKKLFIVISVFAFMACNNQKQDQDALQEEVIKIHDNLMIKGESIMKNKESLNKLLKDAESLDANVKVVDNEDFYKNVNNLIQSLDKADESMMNWMNNFNPDYGGKTPEEIFTYLQQQKQSILKVENQTNIALKNSDDFIAKYQKDVHKK